MTSPTTGHLPSVTPAAPTTTTFGLVRGPRRLLFGPGQRRALGSEVAALGRHALVCTDPWVARTKTFAAMIANLREHDVVAEVFDRGAAELPVSSVEECIAQFGAHEVDVVVGIGGGTCIDLAKAVALVLSHGGPLSRYYGENAVPGPVLPVVAVPTTGGTGSEVTPVCVLTDPAVELKVGISSIRLIPEVALCDPELTLTCPPGLTASAGADALSHLVESFTAVRRDPDVTRQGRVFVGKNDLSDHYARWGLGLMATSLVRVVEQPDDLAARRDVMLAANAGGYALGVAGTAAAHAIQYPIGALTHTPHGVGVGALLPYVMQLNLAARGAEMTEIGTLLGVGAGQDAQAGIAAVAELLARIGIPTTLGEIGVRTDDAAWVAEQSLRSRRLVDNNPRPLDLETVGRVVTAAIAGDRHGLQD